MQRDIADFIQEQSPAIGLLKFSNVVCMGVRESALHVAEEFAFKERFRDGTGIHRHHRFPAPEAPGVDFTGQDILSGTVFAGNKDRGVRWRNLFDSFPDGGHRPGSAPEHQTPDQVGGDGSRHARLRPGISSHRLPGFVTGGREHLNEFLIVPRLHDEVKRSPLHTLNSQGNIGISGKQHNFHLRHHFLDFPGPVEALVAGVDGRVEIHIQKHHIRTEALQRTHQRHRRRQRLHLCKMHRKKYLQRLADAGVVVHNKYFALL